MKQKEFEEIKFEVLEDEEDELSLEEEFVPILEPVFEDDSEINYSRDDEENTIRPKTFDEYIGQTGSKENLKVFVDAAKIRNETLDHVLLYGPPGLGKTTLSMIIANEMGANIKITSGPTIEKTGDLVAILSSLEPGDVLFVDEIHRLTRVVEEVLYPAMEDFCVDVVIGKDSSTRSVRIDLPPFTLVGATTRVGDLTHPLRDRFGITLNLEFYTVEELVEIIKRTAGVFGFKIEENAAQELAKRSRGTPRIANKLFRRVRDFAQVNHQNIVEAELAVSALKRLRIDNIGLDETDHRYLLAIIEKFHGGPVGLDTIASSIGEDPRTLEEAYEPYLLQLGMIKRSSRGRIATKTAYDHFNIDYHNNESTPNLFNQERYSNNNPSYSPRYSTNRYNNYNNNYNNNRYNNNHNHNSHNNSKPSGEFSSLINKHKDGNKF